ncbi:hypothetical protein HPP92_010746 [Vanilla planifolia]|uniref:Trimethylguanosine synthase n=1 Tax=Vanilla planifolia TaxID=51239 RepID=A0A835V029_VANPL|nr:hypothetical protein HPP92_010746 [Vanilla planifolia]
MQNTVHGESSPPRLSRKKRKRAARPGSNSVATISAFRSKYWRQRYSLFSRYDDGIKMDEEGWFSVTPEAIAAEQAAHAAAHGVPVIIDCFAGVGGNAIQFAARSFYVVAIEIDPRKVKCAIKNARIYGVEDKIDFVVGDFFRLAPFLKVFDI